MSPAHHQLHHSADPAHFNCNLGASLAIWDWLTGSLRMPSVEPPRLAFGVSGHTHDPHGVMGLVVDPAVNALKALFVSLSFGAEGRPDRDTISASPSDVPKDSRPAV
jgi:hypothetical protein